jgi:hypothetical protein
MKSMQDPCQGSFNHTLDRGDTNGLHAAHVMAVREAGLPQRRVRFRKIVQGAVYEAHDVVCGKSKWPCLKCRLRLDRYREAGWELVK